MHQLEALVQTLCRLVTRHKKRHTRRSHNSYQKSTSACSTCGKWL